MTSEVRLKDLGRFLGWRDNMLVGYGLVSGLAGSGDTPRSQATRQALANMMSQFDMAITQDQIQSRNVALVTVTATLPPTADTGDRIDVNVTSMGDARSLAGGTLIMTSLRGPDRKMYALAQGPLSVGGYRYDANGNTKLKNHPTSGVVPLGATVEVPVRADLVTDDGYLRFVLKDADASTARRIEQRINQGLGLGAARALDAKTVQIRAPGSSLALNDYVARIETLAVEPDQVSRVVINERTGTVVSGGDTRISPITISHGDIRVSISTEYTASQPGLVSFTGPGVRSMVVGNTDLTVEESGPAVAASFPRGTVGDLVRALSALHISTRDVISILQAIKTAGALHAELVIQ
ncbi:flagellar basal body P-ring protein FlgI [Caballeronia sp. LZ003]|uniref:flagellar basal body P-ring protein FlgI n=1 Tax=Caballeronia sp. LZ003 TaxID=3038559 RepID=UPI0028611362|nr:flagellar basal body P-ring protein FlgI [Caballeronia sp. LZ003]MDR5849596.1 flagellar basal body P-ring protein FlgI [Caballeronia sp. LZ003]